MVLRAAESGSIRNVHGVWNARSGLRSGLAMPGGVAGGLNVPILRPPNQLLHRWLVTANSRLFPDGL